jgi:hypothetical protein
MDTERGSIRELLDGPAVLRIPEAGRFMGLGRAASYSAARTGAIPTIRIGKRRFVVPAAALAEKLGLRP